MTKPKNPKPNTKCIICGKEIYIRPCRMNGYNACSIACRNKWFSKEKHPKWKGGKEAYKSKREYDNNRRMKNKEKAVEYLGGKCINCGYDKCIASLDFHHPDPLSKDDTIKNLIMSSWENIEKEIKKCVLLCANCHREHHWKENRE